MPEVWGTTAETVTHMKRYSLMRFMFAALLWLITFSSVDVASAETPDELLKVGQDGDAGACGALAGMYYNR